MKVLARTLILLGSLILSAMFCIDAASAQDASVKSATNLPQAAGGAPGASISCNILTNNSLQVQGSNTSNKTYQCDVTCNMKIPSGAPVVFNCTPSLPAHTTNGDLCDSSGPFSEVTSGKYTCE
jgi:hypothetical protein